MNFRNEKEYIDYQIEQLNFEPNISLVVSKDTLDEILDGMDFDYEYSKEINSQNYTYLIEKNENEEGQIFIFIEPITFDGDGCMEGDIENDIVIVQKYLLDGDDLEEVYCEELIIVSYEEDNFSECLQDCRFCNGCDEECQSLDEDEDMSLYESLSDMVEEYALLIEDTNGCLDCIRRTLLEFSIDLLENFGMETVD